MPAKKRARQTSARRPAGAVASPAQRRRRQVAVAVPETPRFTRDRILGYGAAAGAVLALVGLNISSLVLLIGLGYLAAAFLRAPETRDWRLRQSAWAFTVIGVLATMAFSLLIGVGSVDTSAGEVSLFAYLPLGRATVVLGTASMATLASAALLTALAFGKQKGERHRRLSQSALCVMAYFILQLPGAVVESPAPGGLGSWDLSGRRPSPTSTSCWACWLPGRRAARSCG